MANGGRRNASGQRSDKHDFLGRGVRVMGNPVFAERVPLGRLTRVWKVSTTMRDRPSPAYGCRDVGQLTLAIRKGHGRHSI